MIRGLFLNTEKAKCSIYESGLMMYNCLKLSDRFEIDYQEIDNNHREIPGGYDFYAFNYHEVTMGWLDTKNLKSLPVFKIVFVLEVSPNDPFVMCPSDVFDAYVVLDPTIKTDDPRVYAFPRPLEVPTSLKPYEEKAVPVIGCFGILGYGKGFAEIVKAVNAEFERALIRFNFSSGKYALYNGEEIIEECRRLAKPGVVLNITRDWYEDKEDLINWCGQNTLNIFLYDRNLPGLAATTDQAVASGRPLAVSGNTTFRHILQYVRPYPERGLKESIAISAREVKQMQIDWRPERFAEMFAKVVEDGLVRTFQHSIRNTGPIILPSKGYLVEMWSMSLFPQIVRTKKMTEARLRLYLPISKSKPSILIISHKQKQCGIYQYGINIYNSLKNSQKYSVGYVECSSAHEVVAALLYHRPSMVLFNYYPKTMPWLTQWITKTFANISLGIFHEVTQEDADRLTNDMFDFWLCPDPTLEERNPYAIRMPRLIPDYVNVKPSPKIPTIGCFGFGISDKGFEKVVDVVQQEFDSAEIRFHMPFNSIIDEDGNTYARATSDRCVSRLYKPGVMLVIDHEFMDQDHLLEFVAGNTINCFFYDVEKVRGISSVIDIALATRVPIAITKSGMFRHIIGATPSICIEDRPLKDIIKSGTAPLEPFYSEWSEKSFISECEKIFNRILSCRKP